MRTEMRTAMWALRSVAVVAAVLIAGTAWAAEAAAEGEAAAKAGADWQHWRADNNVTDMPSVQRGARNFTSYCLGCHSLKYERWSRLGTDLAIPPNLLQKDLIPPGDKDTQYILTTHAGGGCGQLVRQDRRRTCRSWRARAAATTSTSF